MTPQPTPRLVVSKTAEDVTDPLDLRRSTSSFTRTKEQARPAHSDWVDVDDTLPPRRRKRSRRTSTRTDGPTPSTKQRSSISDLGRFLPKLTQILEASESRPQPERTVGRDKLRDDVSVGHRRPVRSKNISVQRKQESKARLNASLLSVISGLTTSTDRSSGSNSTVTQRSYSRSAHSLASSRSSAAMLSRHSILSGTSTTRAASVYSRSHYSQHDEDARSDISTSTAASSAKSSDAGSSVLSGTPSSRSTYPSPTVSRDLPDPASKLDRYSSVQASAGASSEPEEGASVYSYLDHDQDDARQPSLVPTHPFESNAHFLNELQQEPLNWTSPEQETALARLIWPGAAQAHKPVPSTESVEGDAPLVPPPAPDAPDVSNKTLVGYEMLATELCSASAVKPMYRKFEFLNHRLLLHLQDELAELEEQLRTIDEMIAQMSPPVAGPRMPCSRRGEAYYGVELHHYRTNLLGRIFIKTKQYNKAMTSYSKMSRECTPADATHVQTYRAWLTKHAPIHKVETQFLDENKDLVMFEQQQSSQKPTQPKTGSWVMYAPLCFGSPVILVGIISSTFWRLLVLAILFAAIATAAFTTQLFKTFPRRDLVVGFTSYAFCFVAIALMLPTSSSVANSSI